ncbi:MAG: response regulator transcription factor [Bryobacteraceae bacterium]|jgi:two-component system response regulator CpxR
MIAARDTHSILLIDDDRALCALMSTFFSSHDFRLTSAHDGPTGLGRALEGQHDLIILDWMLPGLDGIEILKHLRRKSLTPVIMLTARRMQRDRITGLDAGADDYLPKPFGPQELLARVRAVLRRAEHHRTAVSRGLEVGDLKLAPESREVWQRNKQVEVTSVEYDVLDVLVRSAGKVVSRDEIAAVLYQRVSTPFERAIDVHVCHLRRKLETDGRTLIRSVRGVGYMLVVNRHESS